MTNKFLLPLIISLTQQYFALGGYNFSGSNLYDSGQNLEAATVLASNPLDGSGSVHFNSQGWMGILQKDPHAPLHIRGNRSRFGTLVVETAAGQATIDLRTRKASRGIEGSQRIVFANVSSEDYDNQVEIWGMDGSFLIKTGADPGQRSSTERFRVTASGNVGVGTREPQFLLDVAGVGSFESILSKNYWVSERHFHDEFTMPLETVERLKRKDKDLAFEEFREAGLIRSRAKKHELNLARMSSLNLSAIEALRQENQELKTRIADLEIKLNLLLDSKDK